jgi:hypothetical protein
LDDKLDIPATEINPGVYLDSLSGKMKIEGKSISENPENFFSDVYDWLETHLPSFPDEIEFRIHLSVVRVQSLLEIARLLRLLEKNIMHKKKIRITWIYKTDDEEMKESGLLVDKMIRNDLEFENH